MNLIKIDENASKEEKLNQILECLRELKNTFADLIDDFDDDGVSEDAVDMMTGALDSLEDAHDVILDAIEEIEEAEL
ncbi:MAG: hypothetical protein K5852_06125 [Eubacterium sp.]|nr:hypothetical protein [Eubacterium sp.]